MKRSVLVCLLAAGALVASAQSQNWIYQHNDAYWLDPNDPNSGDPNYYEINQASHRILIHGSKENEPFWFEAAVLQNGQYSGPGNIRLVAADPNAGTVELKIDGNGHDYGAATVDEVNLGGISGAECTLTDVITSGDIGADGDITVDRVTGTWTVGEDGAADILSNMHVGCFLARLSCNTLTDLYVDDECSSTDALSPPPMIEVHGDLAGGIKSQMTNIVIDSITVQGVLTGDIATADQLYVLALYDLAGAATVNVGGDMVHIRTGGIAELASITVNGYVKDPWFGYTHLGAELAGDVHILGDTGHGVQHGGVLGILGEFTGTITVDGDAVDSSQIWFGGDGTLVVGGLLENLTVGDPRFPAVGLEATVDAGTLGILELPYGDLSGAVTVHEDFDGSIQVGADGEPYDLTGSLTFDQDIDGATIEVWGDLGSVGDAAQIRIDGFFGKYSESAIRVHGSLVNASSFVTVDYDATADPWGEYGGICIGDPNDPNDW